MLSRTSDGKSESTEEVENDAHADMMFVFAQDLSPACIVAFVYTSCKAFF